MMSRASLKPLTAIAAYVVLASAGVAVQGRQQDAAKGSQEKAKAAPAPAAAAGLDLAANQALAKEQLALIDVTLESAAGELDEARDKIAATWEDLERLLDAGDGDMDAMRAAVARLERIEAEVARVERKVAWRVGVRG